MSATGTPPSARLGTDAPSMVSASCRRSISRISQGFTSAPRSRWRMSICPAWRFDAQKEGVTGAAGFDHFAIHGREHAHIGLAPVDAEGGAVGLDAAMPGSGRIDCVRRAEQARAEIIEADGHGAIGFGMRPRMAAMIDSGRGERHAEDVGFGRGRDDAGRMYAISLAWVSHSRQSKAFGHSRCLNSPVRTCRQTTVGGRQIVKVRVPADVFARVAFAQVAPRAPAERRAWWWPPPPAPCRRRRERCSSRYAEVKTVVPWKHIQYLPARTSSSTCWVDHLRRLQFALFRKDLEVAERERVHQNAVGEHAEECAGLLPAWRVRKELVEGKRGQRQRLHGLHEAVERHCRSRPGRPRRPAMRGAPAGAA